MNTVFQYITNFVGSHGSEGAGRSDHETSQTCATSEANANISSTVQLTFATDADDTPMTSPASERRVSYSNSVARLLRLNPESAEVISDDGSDSPIQVASPDKDPTSPSPIVGGLTRHGRKDKNRSFIPTTNPSVAGHRLLRSRNQASPKKDHAPTVFIRDPMEVDQEKRQQENMNRAKQFGFKPTNTLDGPQSSLMSSSRASYVSQRISNRSNASKKKASLSQSPIRENNHIIPSKRLRTGNSPKDGLEENPIDIDDRASEGFADAKQAKQLPPSHTLSRKGQVEAVEITKQPITNGTGHTLTTAGRQPSIGLVIDNQKDPEPDKDFTQPSSDDSLFPTAPEEIEATATDAHYFATTRTRRSPSPLVVSTQQTPSLRSREAQRRGPRIDDKRQQTEDQNDITMAESPDIIAIAKPRNETQARKTKRPLAERSASDIASLIVGNSKNKKLLHPRKASTRTTSTEGETIHSWPIVKVAGFYIGPSSNYYRFYLDLDHDKFWLGVPDGNLGGPVSLSRDLGKINILFHGNQSPFLYFKLSQSTDVTSNAFVIEMESRKAVNDLVMQLTPVVPGLNVAEREDWWFPNLYERLVKKSAEVDARRVDSPLASVEEIPGHLANAKKSIATKEQKVTDGLDYDTPPANKRTTIGRSDREAATRKVLGELPVPYNDAGGDKSDQSNSDFVSSHYFQQQMAPARSLRSTKSVVKPKYRTPSPKPKFSRSGGLGTKWEHDLRYPPTGKKRETVEWDDLPRLDEDEFLNDILVSFFARYVQHEVETKKPKLLRTMHFFNTYFFETLTKNSKARKEINHEGVARWTKNIDIFNRDFVIVPVNDNLHWYLAIICNLSHFTEKPQIEEEDDDMEVAEPGTGVEPADNIKTVVDESTQQITEQRQRTQQTQESLKDLTLDDSVQEIPSSYTEPANPVEVIASSAERTSSPAKGKQGRPKKKPARKSLPKYDTDIPIIITLDSLAQPRSAAISALKQYIVQEAYMKKELVIEKDEIRGMTAKGIPHQGNYSDCGLYLCMYLEQFMLDPKGFVRKILQREEMDLRWPTKIRSEELRTRLRDLILELHHRQETGERKKEIPELGEIMVKMREPSPDIIEMTPSKQHQNRTNSSDIDVLVEKNIDAVRQQLKEVERASQENRKAKAEAPMSSAEALETAVRQVDHQPSNPHNPILVDDESPEKLSTRPRRTQKSTPNPNNPPFKLQQPMKPTHTRFSPESSPIRKPHIELKDLHDSPQELAEIMRRRREETGRIEQSPSQSAKAKAKSPGKRQVRSQRASTDFLSGSKSWIEHEQNITSHQAPKEGALESRADNAGNGKNYEDQAEYGDARSELSSEVPETQEEEMHPHTKGSDEMMGTDIMLMDEK